MNHNQADVAVVAAISVFGCATAIVGLPTPVMIVSGFGLFAAPGYVWSKVLLSPRVTGLERVAVAAGLALEVPVLGGLALYAAGISLHRAAWAGLLAGVTLVGAAVLTILRRVTRSTMRPPAKWRPLPVWHVMAFGGAVVIAIGAVVLARVGVDMQKYPGFTQLWLSPRDQDPLTASLGVSNQQGAAMQYRLVLLRRGRVSGTWNLTLADGQTWQHTIAFSDRYRITANLYRLPDLALPYRNVANGDGSPGS